MAAGSRHQSRTDGHVPYPDAGVRCPPPGMVVSGMPSGSAKTVRAPSGLHGSAPDATMRVSAAGRVGSSAAKAATSGFSRR